MNKQETQKILAVLVVTYPNFNTADINTLTNVWEMIFKDYSYAEVNQALTTYLSTNTSGFAPLPAHLIDLIHSFRESGTDENPSAMWDKVMSAISNATYGANEEFNKLPLPAQRVLGSASTLRMMAMNEEFNEDVEKSLFMKTYAEQVKKEKQFNRMPSEVRNMIESNNTKMLEG